MVLRGPYIKKHVMNFPKILGKKRLPVFRNKCDSFLILYYSYIIHHVSLSALAARKLKAIFIARPQQ